MCGSYTKQSRIKTSSIPCEGFQVQKGKGERQGNVLPRLQKTERWLFTDA